jgi:hypothetical protein
MARLMPHVDLRLTPQKCGSLHGVLTLLDRARELGFAGRLHLGNAGMNTELNSIMLVTLAQLLAQEPGAEVLFSAGPKREDASRIRQAWPQVESDEETGTRLSPPEGPGWGARLCRSGLEKRLRKCDFLRMTAVTVDPASLRSLMIIRAFDDSTLDIRQIDFDPEEEEDEDQPYGSDPDGEDPEEGDEAGDDGTGRG